MLGIRKPRLNCFSLIPRVASISIYENFRPLCTLFFAACSDRGLIHLAAKDAVFIILLFANCAALHNRRVTRNLSHRRKINWATSHATLRSVADSEVLSMIRCNRVDSFHAHFKLSLDSCHTPGRQYKIRPRLAVAMSEDYNRR